MQRRKLVASVALAAAAAWSAIGGAPAQEAGGAASGRTTAADAATAGLASATADDLAWLSGSWQMGSDSHVVEEHWTQPAGGSLLGLSRTVKGGKTAFFEYFRVDRDKQGLAFFAQPLGRPATRFALTALAGRKAVFENPGHDFPTRIVYERLDEELLATISGPPDASEKPQTFRYVRAGDSVRLPD